MPYHVWIWQAVEDALDEWLLFDGASQMIADLYRELRNCPDQWRQNRDPDDPQAFRRRVTVTDGGLRHHLEFTICDGWQEGWLYVVGVERTPGGRAF